MNATPEAAAPQTTPKYNVNDLENYSALLAEFKRRFAQRPQPLRRPYVLWGRYMFEIQANKSVQVKPCIKEMSVTVSSGEPGKLARFYRRGWRILDYWIPAAHELPPVPKDQILYGWRYQYHTDPEIFERIKRDVATYAMSGKGLNDAHKLKIENAGLKDEKAALESKVAELTARLKADGQASTRAAGK